MSVALSTQGAHHDVYWLRSLLRVKDLLTAQVVKTDPHHSLSPGPQTPLYLGSQELGQALGLIIVLLFYSY